MLVPLNARTKLLDEQPDHRQFVCFIQQIIERNEHYTISVGY